MEEKQPKILHTMQACCRALEDKKALDIKVLFLGERSSITDYVVIATGNSDPHLRALRGAVESTLKDEQYRNVGLEYQADSGWAVVDGVSFMIHLFLPETRELYDLERLWKDADVVDVDTLLENEERASG